MEWLASATAGAGAWIMANPGVALLAAGVLLVVRLGLPGIRAKRHAGDKGAVSAETAMVDRKTGDPAVGWMRFYEAVRLAEEYALPLKEMTSKVAATRLVEEFIERRRDHYDERTRFVGGMVGQRAMAARGASNPGMRSSFDKIRLRMTRRKPQEDSRQYTPCSLSGSRVPPVPGCSS